MNDFVKELNFESDTFENIKRDMNFVLQRLLGNMQEKGSTDGTMTVKIDMSLVREWVPNYNPEIEEKTRMVSKPKFKHKVTSQVQIKDEKSGNLDTEMELFLNEETGEYEMRPVADTTQRSIFDADFREAEDETAEAIEAKTGQNYIEHPALPGEVADEGALPGTVEEYDEGSVCDDSEDFTDEDTQNTDDEDTDGAGNGNGVTFGSSCMNEPETDEDDYGYEEPEEE